MENKTQGEDGAAEWCDITSYSRDRPRVPTSFVLKIGGLRLSVTSSHIYYPGKWVMHCQPFFDTYLLAGKTEAEAKCQAFALVQVQIGSVSKAIADYIEAGNVNQQHSN